MVSQKRLRFRQAVEDASDDVLPKEFQQPKDLKRRDFLKFCGTLAAGALMPCELKAETQTHILDAQSGLLAPGYGYVFKNLSPSGQTIHLRADSEGALDGAKIGRADEYPGHENLIAGGDKRFTVPKGTRVERRADGKIVETLSSASKRPTRGHKLWLPEGLERGYTVSLKVGDSLEFPPSEKERKLDIAKDPKILTISAVKDDIVPTTSEMQKLLDIKRKRLSESVPRVNRTYAKHGVEFRVNNDLSVSFLAFDPNGGDKTELGYRISPGHWSIPQKKVGDFWHDISRDEIKSLDPQEKPFIKALGTATDGNFVYPGDQNIRIRSYDRKNTQR